MIMEPDTLEVYGSYMELLEYIGVEIDKEDGSTAPFTSYAMEVTCSLLST